MEALGKVEECLFGGSIRIPWHAPPPKSILDVGCGSGTWAQKVAKLLPDTEVLGVDLSPTYVADEPDNLSFEVIKLCLSTDYIGR